MLRNTKLNRIAIAVAMSIGMSTAAFAQETSSGIKGQVTTPTGTAAANTKVVITHIPSGTTKTVTTSDNGTFQAQGLRVGGPYKILIDSDEFRDSEFNGVFLQLGETERLEAQLEAVQIEKITVTSSAPVFVNSGGSSYFGEDAIQNSSGLTRDVKDVIRANPLVTILPGDDAAITIAGQNPRFNSITVDGIGQNDDFGLNSGGYPTQRSPLPFDALEQVTVDVAPFDAKQSGFTGGVVNAVFKSGTNEFHGGVFYEKLTSDWAGTPKDLDGEEVPVEFEDKTYGFNLGGALIQDTLFFFGSYEKYEAPQSLEWGAAGSGAANETEATLAEVTEVQRIAREVYGLTDEQVGSPTGSPVEQDEKWVMKLDWNINDDHRAAFTYQFNEGNRTSNITNSEGELRLSSHWYDRYEKINNYSAKLYSDWTSDFSTEISYTKLDKVNRQQSFGDFADVTILNLPSGGNIAFGSDNSRHANSLNTQTTTFQFDGTYLLDEHKLGFGVEFKELAVQNLYVPNSKGTIVFDGLENFEDQFADSYFYSNGTGNDPYAVGADFQTKTFSLYAQDDWDLTDDLSVQFGLRYETISNGDKPPYNAKSEARTGLDNTENLDGVSILLPRVGFQYTVNDDLTVRGGVGRYTGGTPLVWVSNSYSENGVNAGQYSADEFTIDSSAILNILPAAAAVVENAASDGDVSLVDPDYKLPSDWRYQLAADYVFDIPGVGDNFAWTSEVLYIKKQDSSFWKDASLSDADFYRVAADGKRIIYRDTDTRRDTMLTNADGGRSIILSTSLGKEWDNGVSVTTSYAHQDITEVNPGTSSTAHSNYRYSDGINRNVAADQLGTAAFQVEHRFVVNLGYNTELFEGYETNINLFFERRSGNPVTISTNFDSRVLSNDVKDVDGKLLYVEGLSPESTAGDYTTYIPTADDANVVYTDPALQAELMAAINERGLAGYAGGYAPKGSATSPWVTTLDLSVQQEIPGFMEGHKGKIYFVVDNLLNLIDSSAGKVVDNEFGTLRLYDVDSIDSQGRYVIDRVRDDGNRFNAEESAWKIKIGVRYDF